MRSEVIAVGGMQCGGCERSVVTAVLALPGVAEARADFVAEEVEVVYEPDAVDVVAIRAAVRAAGFTAA